LKFEPFAAIGQSGTFWNWLNGIKMEPQQQAAQKHDEMAAIKGMPNLAENGPGL
jgi:hypothetical protein